MKKSQLRQLIREEIKKSYLNESLEALISKATKIQAFVDKQGKKDGYEGGVHSPVGGVLTALKVAGGPGFDGDEELKGYYTRKLSKAIDTQLQKKYMSGFSVGKSESVNEGDSDPMSNLLQTFEKAMTDKATYAKVVDELEGAPDDVKPKLMQMADEVIPAKRNEIQKLIDDLENGDIDPDDLNANETKEALIQQFKEFVKVTEFAIATIAKYAQ